MRTLVSKDIQQKIAVLEARQLDALTTIIDTFEKKSKDEILRGPDRLNVLCLAGDVYVAKRSDVCVYFFIGKDPQGEYLMLLDVTGVTGPTSQKRFFAVRDPKTNSTLNPACNSAINPNYNSSLNPASNSAINPKYNSAINPKYNSALGGPFLYDLDLNQLGYVVRANDSVSIVFNMEGQWTEFIVQHQNGVSLLFDWNTNWIGYFAPTDQGSMLRFSTSGQWTGLLI